LNADAKKYLDIVKSWDRYTNPEAIAPTIYQQWFDSLEVLVWDDELDKASPSATMPDEQTLFEYLVKDSAFKYVDNINTPQVETLTEMVTLAFKKIIPVLAGEQQEDRLAWTKFKNPTIYHLLRTAVMPFSQEVHVGGWSNVINATTTSHGPSWRMIVHLTGQTEAYGVYPGGQSGNPGSRFYNSFVNDWANGKYYALFFMKKLDAGDNRIKWRMSFSS
jgi:penicillin G amidase